MNLPQFTAELAIYRTRHSYQEYSATPATDDTSMTAIDALAQAASVVPAGKCGPFCYGTPPNCFCLHQSFDCPANASWNFQTHQCVCNPGYTTCGFEAGAAWLICADTKTNSANCGSCGVACELPSMCCNGSCANPQTDSANCGHCGNACKSPSICVEGCCMTNSEELQPLEGNQNYLLSRSDCNNIEGLNVSLTATENLEFSNGFSIQLNAFNPLGSTIDWMQFAILVNSGEINATIQYWDLEAWYACCTMGMTSQWCLNNCSSDFPYELNSWPLQLPGPLSSNTFPANWTLGIELLNDGSGNITGANFYVTDNAGTPQPTTLSLDPAYYFPINAFSFNLVGYGNGSTTTFSNGGAGTLTYKANDPLCIQGGLPNKCGGYQLSGSGGDTGENSNAVYGPLNSCCGSPLSQSFTT
jgi:hypothetical protein